MTRSDEKAFTSVIFPIDTVSEGDTFGVVNQTGDTPLNIDYVEFIP